MLFLHLKRSLNQISVIMKKHFLLVGAIICLLSASCVQNSDLTLSGLNPMAYQTIVNDA